MFPSSEMLVQFAEATERGDAEKIQHLLQSGDLPLDIMVPRDGFGKSALSLAATYGQTAVVEQLLKVIYIYTIVKFNLRREKVIVHYKCFKSYSDANNIVFFKSYLTISFN